MFCPAISLFMNENDNKKIEQEVSWEDVLKKCFKFLKSMKFSVLILAVMIAACVYGSLGHDVYHKTWFLVMAIILCINMMLCSISRFPAVLKAFRVTGCKKFSVWGSWICHLGIFLVIIGFALGQQLAEEYEVYGIAGSSQVIPGTEYTLSIDSFDINMRDDFTVEQYIAGLTMTDGNGNKVSGTASVNHPMEAFGYSLYQDSTGWANYVDIYRDGQLQDTDLICVGEYTYPLDNPTIVLQLNRFYPDFVDGGQGNYYSKTPLLNNPMSLYSIYYQNQMLEMNFSDLKEPISVDNYEFMLHDPTEYTLIIINHDPTALFVGIAAGLVLIGVFMAFYLKPYEEKKYASKARES